MLEGNITEVRVESTEVVGIVGIGGVYSDCDLYQVDI